jgi:hypothetical protein
MLSGFRVEIWLLADAEAPQSTREEINVVRWAWTSTAATDPLHEPEHILRRRIAIISATSREALHSCCICKAAIILGTEWWGWSFLAGVGGVGCLVVLVTSDEERHSHFRVSRSCLLVGTIRPGTKIGVLETEATTYADSRAKSYVHIKPSSGMKRNDVPLKLLLPPSAMAMRSSFQPVFPMRTLVLRGVVKPSIWTSR